jgi:hypothetical protein
MWCDVSPSTLCTAPTWIGVGLFSRATTHCVFSSPAATGMVGNVTDTVGGAGVFGAAGVLLLHAATASERPRRESAADRKAKKSDIGGERYRFARPHASFFTVSWPTGEFGGMNLEGAIRLGMKKQLEAVTDPAAREEMFQGMVAMAYERGKATNMAALLEIDAVIDPADTRA